MSETKSPKDEDRAPKSDPAVPQTTSNPDKSSSDEKPAPEVGGRDGLDPTRFGDWEKNGRCIDF